MKSILVFLLGMLLLVTPFTFAGGKGSGYTKVKGYTTKSGTYVAPHVRTKGDGNKFNNMSTKGNVNPFTGKAGTKNPY